MLKRLLNNLDNLLLAGLLFAILPFFVLSFFTHPQNDDYVLAMYTRAFGLLGGVVRWYLVWTGRYFSCAVIGANPLVFGSFAAYKIVTAGFILLLLHSVYFFISEFTSRAWSIKQRTIVSLTVLALFLYQMPNLQGMHCLSLSLCNVLGIVLMLYLFGLLFRMDTMKKGTARVLYVILALFLIFAISGTHELPMIYTFVILTAMVILHGVKHRRLHPLWAMFVFVSLLCSLAVILAPGNVMRYTFVHQGQPDNQILASLKASFVSASSDIGSWLFTSPLLLFVVLLVPFIAKMTHKTTTAIVHPVLSNVLFLLMLFGSYFASYQGAGTIEPRTINGVYLFFLAGLLFNIYNTVVYLKAGKDRQFPALPASVVAAVSVLILLILVVKDSNMKTAYADLLSGTAYRYDKEMNERYAAIEACPSYVCDVEPLRNRPETLYWFESAIDEKADSEFLFGYKRQYAAYFHKMAIKLRSAP